MSTGGQLQTFLESYIKTLESLETSVTFLGLCNPEDEDITIPETSANLLGLSYSEDEDIRIPETSGGLLGLPEAGDEDIAIPKRREVF